MKVGFVREPPELPRRQQRRVGRAWDIPLMACIFPTRWSRAASTACASVRTGRSSTCAAGCPVIRRVASAVREAYAAASSAPASLGFRLRASIVVHSGAGAICGERRRCSTRSRAVAQPRLSPPFPRGRRPVRRPMVINNVETIANLPTIVLQRRRLVQTVRHREVTRLQLLRGLGPVERPGIYEVCDGITMLGCPTPAACAGQRFEVPGSRRSSVPMLTPEHLDVPLTYEDMAPTARCSAPAARWSSTRRRAWSRHQPLDPS